MAKPQARLKQPPEFTTDVVSRHLTFRPWAVYKPEPQERVEPEHSFLTILRASEGVMRIKVKKPGDFNRVSGFDVHVDEKLDYHDSKPDLFEGGIGKSYNGFRIAYVEEEGFIRIENDGFEHMAIQFEISMFKQDLADAARSDENIRSYIASKGII
jgi:hypothetical protein